MTGGEKPTIQGCLNDNQTTVNSETLGLKASENAIASLDVKIQNILDEVELETWSSFHYSLGFDSAEALKAIIIEHNGYNLHGMHEVIAEKLGLGYAEVKKMSEEGGFTQFYENLISSMPLRAFIESKDIMRNEYWDKVFLINETHDKLPKCLKEATSN